MWPSLDSRSRGDEDVLNDGAFWIRAGFELDYRIVHPSGEIRDMGAVGHPVLSPSGDLVEFVGTVMDVTERKRGEQATRLLAAVVETR